jgi:CubicO group peptidase (beta-lactamase class C family)
MPETAQLEAVITAWMDRHQAPGLAVAVISGGQLTLMRGFGSTSVEEGATPVTSSTLFRILSTTKMLVGTALMRLVEQNILGLDTPVSTYLHWLHLSQPGLEDRISLRHLLSHTSGLGHFPADFSSRNSDGLQVWAHEYLPSYPVLTPPGRVWLYSNTGLCLAAYIAQVVTATPFTGLMQELLFDPVNMSHTTFDPLVALTHHCALGHSRQDEDWVVDHQFVQNTAWDPAGGALSCVQDLVQVTQLYLQNGTYQNQQLLSPETIELMHSPLVRCWTLDEGGYGLAWATSLYKGCPLVRHNGGGVSSFQSVFILAPSQASALVLLANGGRVIELVSPLLDRILTLPAEAVQPAAPPDVTADWPSYCGTYLGPYTGLVTVDTADQELWLTRNGTCYRLESHCPRHYVGRAEERPETISVGFPAPEPTGALSDFVVVDDSPCQRIAQAPVCAPEPERWAAYVGRYELPGGPLMLVRDLQVEVEVEGSALYLRYEGQKMPCLPLTPTTFACDAGVITFQTAEGTLLEFQRTMLARPVGARAMPSFTDLSSGR